MFVDTGAWYAIVDKSDPKHNIAKVFFLVNKLPFLTTNFIFDETITLIRVRLGWNVAKDFGLKLKNSISTTLLSVKNEDEERAWEIFLKYKDKNFSYTDCTSFAIMERLKIDTAFSFDKHFTSIKFNLLPL